VPLKLLKKQWKGPPEINPDQTCFHDEYMRHLLYITRIYFHYGLPESELIGRYILCYYVVKLFRSSTCKTVITTRLHKTRPCYDHCMTLCVTTGLLHCGLNNKIGTTSPRVTRKIRAFSVFI